MLAEILRAQALYQVLYQIDQEFAEQHRQNGCLHCKGPLHQSNYTRKPRGGPDNIPEEYCRRQSLCCAVDGCRRRHKPPSVLFMERRVYWGCVVLVTTTLLQGRVTGYSAGRLMRQFGMSRKTLKRWMKHFREIFPLSAVWKKLRGRVSSEVRDRHLPEDLLEAFRKIDPGEGGVVACLRFLAGGVDPCY
jgi:hypothetical protein